MPRTTEKCSVPNWQDSVRQERIVLKPGERQKKGEGEKETRIGKRMKREELDTACNR